MSLEPYYDRDGITIYCGDCRDILPQLPQVDLVLTDPPYGEVNRDSGGLRNLNKGVADIVTIHPTDFVSLVSGKFLSFYAWCGISQVSDYRQELVQCGYTTRLCVWEKSNPSPMNGEHLWLSSVEACVFARTKNAKFNGFCESPVWRGPVETEQRHPTQKPVWLFRKLVATSSDERGVVLDPFMGSGTTLLAAKLEGRRAIGIEIEERYCELAKSRLRQKTMF